MVQDLSLEVLFPFMDNKMAISFSKKWSFVGGTGVGGLIVYHDSH